MILKLPPHHPEGVVDKVMINMDLQVKKKLDKNIFLNAACHKNRPTCGFRKTPTTTKTEFYKVLKVWQRT
jgi:hypothetical protein